MKVEKFEIFLTYRKILHAVDFTTPKIDDFEKMF